MVHEFFLTVLFLTLALVVGCGPRYAPTIAPPTATPTPVPPAVASPTATPPPSPTEVEGKEVVIQGFAFNPERITVPVGTTVTWTEQDSARHTVTSKDDLFDSGTLSKGHTFSFTFTEAGTYEYFCRIHPQMIGTIVVQ